MKEKETPRLEIAESQPHARGQLATSPETAATASAAHAQALVQARYTVALKYPRDFDAVRERMLKACKRPGFAKVARFRKPIGKGIEGPSIRFAEEALRSMGNVVIEPATLFDDREKRIIQVTVTDLESNTTYCASVTIDKSVERKKTQPGDNVIRERLNSRGERVFIIEATDDDILNKQNALLSKAIRTQGLRLVPSDIVEECMAAVLATQADADAKDPNSAKREIFDHFNVIGVTVGNIKEWLGHPGDVLTPKELTDLRALYSAIKDGETTWREVMDDKIKPETGGLAAAVDGASKPEAEKAPAK
jgi:hypothetical protein